MTQFDEPQPRPRTKEEMRELFLDCCRSVADYWSRVEGRTPREMCDGAIFSLLNILDGTAGDFPCAVNLVMQPHSSDRQFCISEGENWVEEGQVINDDVMLHEMYYLQQ